MVMQDMKYIRPHYGPTAVPEPAVFAREAYGGELPQNNKSLSARAPISKTDYMGHRWDHALMSVPPGMYLDGDYWDLENPNDVSSDDVWITALDESRFQGQVIYMVEENLGHHDVSTYLDATWSQGFEANPCQLAGIQRRSGGRPNRPAQRGGARRSLCRRGHGEWHRPWQRSCKQNHWQLLGLVHKRRTASGPLGQASPSRTRFTGSPSRYTSGSD